MGSPDPTAAFDALAGELEYPMYIVTTAAGDERSGCLVGFLTQCSISPPALLVCISKKNRTFRVATRATSLAVHFLGRDDLPLAELFGEQTGDDVDKFAQCGWTAGPGGVPVLEGCRGWVVGAITSRTDVGDHVAHAVRVTHAQVRDVSAPQLGFVQSKSMEPGHRA